MARGSKKVSKTAEEAELATATKEWKRTKKVPQGYITFPPDGGYGWVVITGAFINTCMISVPTLVFGIILKDMIAFTGSTTAQASWTVSISLAVSQFVGPVSTILIHQLTCRVTSIIGGILIAIGLFLSAFCPSIQLLYFTFGVLTGVGMGFSRAPCLVIASQYFRVRFGIATGIVFAGFGCGRLVFSPICQKALDHFGFQGTFIIISGICLNICVGAALFQPVKKYLVLKKVPQPAKPLLEIKPKVEPSAEQQKALEAASNGTTKPDDVWIRMTDAEKEKFLDYEERERLTGTKIANYLVNASSVESIHQVVKITPARPVQAVKAEPTPRPTGCWALFKKQLDASLDFTLLKNPIFYLICFSSILTYLTILYSNIFLVPLAVDRGLSPFDASIVVTAKAAAEIVGRIGFPWIQQLLPIDPVLFYVIICSLVGFALLAQAIVLSFPLFITVAILAGALSGGTVVQNTTVTLLIMGAPKYPSVIGLCSFIQSFFALFAGPFIGWVRDVTGSFVQCYFLIMGVQFFAGVMWFARFIYVKCCAS